MGNNGITKRVFARIAFEKIGGLIEDRFDLRALINVYAWSMARRPLGHKGEEDKWRNGGSMSRHGQGCA